MNYLTSRFRVFAFILSATTAGFSQETPTTPAPANTLPVQRTLTATDGRKLDVTITEKTATAIKGKTVSGKEFDITLNKLSTEDQAFIAGLVAAPVKKPTVLLVEDKKRPVLDLLEKAGFAVTNVPGEVEEGQEKKATKDKDMRSTIGKMTDDEIKKFDVIWINNPVEYRGNTITHRLIDLIPLCKIVVWRRDWFIKREEWIKTKSPREHELTKTIPYVKSDKNLILFFDVIQQYNSTEKKVEAPEFRQKAIEEATKLMATHH